MNAYRRFHPVALLAAALALIGSLLAACGGAPATPTAAPAAEAQPTQVAEAPTPEGPQAMPTGVPGPNAVVLNYWDMQWGGTEFMNRLQDNVTEFNKEHPEIFVNFQQLSWGDYQQKLLSAVQAGNPPDISGGDSGIPFYMHAQGETLEIDDLFREWETDGTFDDMVPWAYEKWNYEGKRLGITWQFDGRAIFYRKDLFEQAGIEPPTNWDELMAAAKKLHNPEQGIIGIAVPGKQGSYDTDQFYMTFVFQAGGNLADPQGRPTFDTPEQLKALEFARDLAKCCAAEATPAWTFTEVLQAFQQGKAAMAFGGGWFIGATKRDAPEIYKNMGILPVLEGPGGPEARHMVAFANPWMIYKQTKHPEEAKIFLRWMMRKENLLKLYASDPGGKWPVYRSMLEDPTFADDPLVHEFAQQIVDHGVDYWYPNNNGAVGIGSLGTSIADIIVNPVLSGQREPAEVLRDAQEKLAPLFEKQ
ncbi:MAG TPA: sugar ABC transporter substrate-binding protein [Roseiflexaceae bacterium]|nr:sugar ABC transporter substrate-binding protein [Roseiflexaceae bacterium]